MAAVLLKLTCLCEISALGPWQDSPDVRTA